MSLVQVYNEWDPLEEVIVGSPLYARLPTEDKGYYSVERLTSPSPPFPAWMIEETEEDILQFISELQKLNITVKRPTPIEFTGRFKTLDWEAENYFCYCPRDILLAFDNMIIESPNVFRSRYFETWAYKSLLIDYLRSGTKWIAAPKPRLLDEIYNENPSHSVLKNIEPVFDAANILRAGYDLFYLLSDSGNELGCQWLQALLGDRFRVHLCRHLYSSTHIDTTLILLRPGLALINPSRVNESNLPAPLSQWKILPAPEMVKYQYSDFPSHTSVWLGMNLLSLRPDLVVVDAHQLPLIQLLEKNKIEVLPLKLRHGPALGGGFHCITLDIRRKGILENYF